MNQLLCGEKIVKSFGTGDERRNILNGVSVEIGRGEFVSVMGPSGSGKSTLLYALSGMDGIDGGRVTFEGRDLATLSDDALSDLRRNEMGFVFQQPTFLKTLNILDNIILHLMRDNRRNVKQLVQKARTLMKQVGIEDLEKQYNMAQKVFDEKLSVRETEKLVKKVQKEKEEVEKTKMDKQLEIVYQDLEEKMKQILGTKVSINAKDENKGKIEIEYYNKEDLDRLIDMILK